jgi:hypothetical protein
MKQTPSLVAMPPLSSQPFFMYTSRALDHEWLQGCAGFHDYLQTSQRENLGEVHMRRLLARHPLRTHNPDRARMFFVPIFEYASYALDDCNGSTHSARMTAARDELVASSHWRQHRGLDHIFVSTAWSYASRTRPFRTMWSRMAPLSEALRCAMAGRYKDERLSVMSAVGNCALELPYPAPAVHPLLRRPPAPDGGRERPLLLHFAGSFDVCCHGRAVRCTIAQLMVSQRDDPRILIRPTPNATFWGRCTRHAMATLHKLQNGSSVALRKHDRGRGASRALPGRRLMAAALPVSSSSSGGRVWGGRELRDLRPVGSSGIEQSAREMAAAIFCLSPAGDTCVTSRLYAAIAAGCIPVVVCDPLRGAFPAQTQYPTFWVKVGEKEFTDSPGELLRRLRAMPPGEIRGRQQALAAHRADVIYDDPESRVATNFLEALCSKCNLGNRRSVGATSHMCRPLPSPASKVPPSDYALWA